MGQKIINTLGQKAREESRIFMEKFREIFTRSFDRDLLNFSGPLYTKCYYICKEISNLVQTAMYNLSFFYKDIRQNKKF